MLQLILSPESASHEEPLTPPISAPDATIDTPVGELGQIVMHALEETDQLIRYVTAAGDKVSAPQRRFMLTRPSRRTETQSNAVSHDELFESIRARVMSLHEQCLHYELDAPASHPTFQHLIELYK